MKIRIAAQQIRHMRSTADRPPVRVRPRLLPRGACGIHSIDREAAVAIHQVGSLFHLDRPLGMLVPDRLAGDEDEANAEGQVRVQGFDADAIETSRVAVALQVIEKCASSKCSGLKTASAKRQFLILS